ncbi:hypothetical protein ACOAKC_04945 [Hathewaya histolytica]|uniref:hypothetical protein n=1 Tax=Hathewaya histolytica TaxID=1498 RepID=UPI003B686072
MIEENIDYYIALVGTNPLPNYISALNFCSEDTVVYLVYTNKKEKIISSKVLAEGIKEEIEKKKHCKNINLQPCDKSEFKEVKKIAKKVFQDIKNQENFEDTGDNEKNIVLDYTGGTKIMSAIFYDKFKEFESECNYKFNIKFSYVDNSKRKILYENYGDIERSKFEDIAKENNVTIEDIFSLHGYSVETGKEELWQDGIRVYGNDENKLIFKNNREGKVDVGKLYLKDFTLCAYKVSDKSSKDKCKHEMFILKDDVEKLGGSEACMIYKYYFNKDKLNDHKEIEEKIRLKEVLRKEFINTCSINMEGRILVLNNYCKEDEEVKDFFSDMDYI